MLQRATLRRPAQPGPRLAQYRHLADAGTCRPRAGLQVTDTRIAHRHGAAANEPTWPGVTIGVPGAATASRHGNPERRATCRGVPDRIRLGEIAPDMVRLEAEAKQITHAIRMAACNAETALARALDGHYARAGHEAYALIREALATSGDICPGNGQLLIRLDPLTAPRRTQALSALRDQLNQTQACYPGTDLVLRYEVKPHPGIGSPGFCESRLS